MKRLEKKTIREVIPKPTSFSRVLKMKAAYITRLYCTKGNKKGSRILKIGLIDFKNEFKESPKRSSNTSQRK